MAIQDTGIIVLDRELYLKILEKAKGKRLIDKHEFFNSIPLFRKLRAKDTKVIMDAAQEEKICHSNYVYHQG